MTKVEIDGKEYCVETLIHERERLIKEVKSSAELHRLVLNQIRAEIEHWESDDTQDDYQIGAMDMQKYVLRVIDKYTKEQTE